MAVTAAYSGLRWGELTAQTISQVDVLPATIDLAAAEVELVNMTLRELVLRDVLAKVRSRFNQMKNQGDAGPAARTLMAATFEGGSSELADALKLVDEQMLTGASQVRELALGAGSGGQMESSRSCGQG